MSATAVPRAERPTSAGLRAYTARPLILALCTALLAVLALGCLPIVAQASATATETAKLTVAFSPYRLGSTTSINFGVDIAGPNGELPAPVTSFNMEMPAELELVGSTLGLAICQPAGLMADGLSGCSPNAQLGSGTATAEVPFGPEIVSETAHVEALMGPPVGDEIGVLVYAESQTPVFAQLVFPGVLLVNAGPESLNTTFPPVATLPGARDAAVTKMTLEVGPAHLRYYKLVHGREVGFRPTGISLPSKCPRGGFRFVADLGFLDGTTLKLPAVVPCPHSRRR